MDFLFYSGDANLESRLDSHSRISEQVVLQLVDRLPIAKWNPPPLTWTPFCIVTDNWFTTASLCAKLRLRGHAALGTVKSEAGIAAEQLESAAKLTKAQHHGHFSKEQVDGIDSWLIVDNKPLFLLTTIDFSNDVNVPKPARKHRGISQQNIYVSENKEVIPFKAILLRYNKHMGASDINAQVRSYYSKAAHRHNRNWIAIFAFLLDACVVNAYYCYE